MEQLEEHVRVSPMEKYMTKLEDMLGNEDFVEHLKRRLGLIHDVFGVKQGEYATGGDALHNFNTAAGIYQACGMPVTREMAIMGMAMKHLVSLFDLIKQAGNSPEHLDPGRIEEKCGDLINYIILLEASLYKTADTAREKLPF